MAMIQCPECGKQISDKAQSCPNCGCPSSCFTQMVEPIEEQTEMPQYTQNQTSRNGAIGKVLFAILAGVVAILAYIAKSYLLMVIMGGFALMELGIAFELASGDRVQSVPQNKQDKRLRCANCGGYQIAVSVSTVNEVYGSTREVREKNAITRHANHEGRRLMNLATFGLWSLTPKRSDYKETERVKSRNVQYKTAVCQSCGYSWYL